MDLKLLCVFAASLLFLGCCCAATPDAPTGSCPYGTYGSACSEMCSRLQQAEGCTSQCLDSVKSEGLGDATTCCKSTFRQWCQDLCGQNQYTPQQECMADCAQQYADFGISLDSCYVPV
jgi:hypothetical protein